MILRLLLYQFLGSLSSSVFGSFDYYRIMKSRFLELDIWRGLAVIGMAIFHTFFVFHYVGIIIPVNTNILPLDILGTFVRFSFLLLVGIALFISKKRGGNFHLRQMKRGIVVLCGALFVSLFTIFFIKERIVIFGVLHLIAVSILLLQFVADKKNAALFIAMFVFLFSFAAQTISGPPSILLHILGFKNQGFYTLDYFPIFPWMAVIALGIYLGNIIYKKNRSILNLSRISNWRAVRFTSFLGRHAFIFYMIHFPVIIGVALLIKALMH